MDWDREKEEKAGKAIGIGSSIFGLLFACFWCVAAVSMGAWFMLIFGIPFVGMMVYRLYLCIQYAKTGKKTSQSKEADPWDRPPATDPPKQENTAGSGNRFCPYCGGGIQEDFEFCPKCGRRQR